MQHYTSHPYANRSKYISIEIYGSQGTMLLYDKTIILESITNSRVVCIVATFNKNNHRAIHIIAIYKAPFLSLMTFLSTIQKLISNSSTICHTIILGEFDVGVLQKQTSEATHLFQFMNVNQNETSILSKYHNIWFTTRSYLVKWSMCTIHIRKNYGLLDKSQTY
jgi:hypothetical protein